MKIGGKVAIDTSSLVRLLLYSSFYLKGVWLSLKYTCVLSRR